VSNPANQPDATPGAGTQHDSSRFGVSQRRTRRRRFAALAVVVVTAVVSVAIWQAVSKSPTVDSVALVGPTGRAPSYSLPSMSAPNHVVSLASFLGRPLVLNFWASWCVPCRKEMPVLEAAFRSEAGKVMFVGIDSNDSTSAARLFLTQTHVTYLTISDPNGTTATKYRLYGLPTTVFISPSGKIIGRHIGELHADTLREALKEAFGA
jgi:cytochrome c biogenesis protein CcmG/thiol:disulfide interchange protein DsbE